MSIYISGLSLPKDGEMLVLCVGYNGKVLHPIEFSTEDFLFAETGKTAIELPPHGRLGDLDALIIDLMDRGVDGVQTDDLHEILQTIMDANTIIPAEEEEGDADG